MRVRSTRRRKIRLRIAGIGTRYTGDVPRNRPLKRNIEGTPIPDSGTPDEIGQKLLTYWPVWDLQDQLEKEGIVINRVVFRTGWVKLHIDWWQAEGMWGHKLTAEIIRDIVAMAANEKELYFNHWQVIRPPTVDVSTWDTLSTAAREAIVYFRTDKVHGKSVHDLLQHCKLEEVNSIILANAFSLSEKQGLHDQD